MIRYQTTVNFYVGEDYIEGKDLKTRIFSDEKSLVHWLEEWSKKTDKELVIVNTTVKKVDD